MANYLDLIDNSLARGFNAPVYDPKKGREALVAVVDKAAEQHKNGETPNIRSWKLGNNGAISFTAKVRRAIVPIGGAETNHVPAERFQDFLKALRAAIVAGELDNEIKAALESDEKPSKAPSAAKGASRSFSPQSKLNIRVGGFRRGGKSDDEIRTMLKAEGIDKAMIDAALAPKA